MRHESTIGSVILCSVFLLVTGMMAAHAESVDVRIATDVPYAPMEFVRKDGSLAGFDIELGNAICAQAELNCTWQAQEWRGIIPGLLAHRYDAIMSAMTITEHRRQKVAFSEPYIVIGSAFFATADHAPANVDASVLKGKHVGVQRGTIEDVYVTDTYGDVATIMRYASIGELIADMQSGRLQFAFLTQITGQAALLDAYPGRYQQVGDFVTTPEAVFGDGMGIAVRPEDSDLLRKINAALAALQDDGTYERIHAKYFDTPPVSVSK